MKWLNTASKITLAILLTGLTGCASSGSVSSNDGGQMTLRNYLEQEPGVIITGEGPSTSVTIRAVSDISGRKTTRPLGKGSVTSVQTENSPLFVIDGNTVGRNFYRVASMLTPAEIEDVRVLSPTEAAHFGSRGAHGAVIITTRDRANMQ